LARGTIRMNAEPLGATLQGSALSFANLVNALSPQLDRPVIDKSGLQPGLYDFLLQFAPDPGQAPSSAVRGGSTESAPSIFTAVQEQLGLRLVSSNGPVDILVIDSIRKPQN